MRVLHVIPSVSASQGGPSYAIAAMERALAGRGCHVETATTDDDGPGRRRERHIADCHDRVLRRYFAKTTDPYKISWSFASWVFGAVRSYDLVHIHSLFSFTSVMAALAARRAGVPYVLRPLGVLARYGMSQRRPWLKRLSLAMLEGRLLRDAAAVHFTSEMERDEALALGIPMKPVVIPLAVAAEEPGDARRLLRRLPALSDGLHLVFLSRIDPKKNLEGLLRALAFLNRDGCAASLLVGGSGAPEYVARMRSLARAEGVADRVHWLGHVSGADKADLLALGDVFVLPSFSENFGVAVAEALAAGLPCVVGKGVALAVHIETARAGVVTNTDPQSIAAAIRSIPTSKAGHAAMSQRARALAQEKFSMQTMGERLERLYRHLVAGARSGEPQRPR